MRILQIAHAFPPTVGGVETHLWDLGHELARRGHETLFVVGGVDIPMGHDDPRTGISVERHHDLTVGHLIAQRRGLARAARNDSLFRSLMSIFDETVGRFQPDVVHLHNAHHFAPELAESVFAAIGPRPVFNSVHDRVGEHIYEAVLNEAWTGVVYASQYLHAALPTTRPFLVRHLSVDLAWFSPNGARDPRMTVLERPVIFHPARLLRWKGVRVGLEAFALVRRRIGHGTLVLCASNNTVEDARERASFRAELETRASELGVGAQVPFLPFQREQMPSAYRASDLAWYPTIAEEPLGLVPMEAYACRVPLIVSRSGGMVETVEHGRTGLVVEQNDAHGLADAAFQLLTQRELASTLIEEGAARAPLFSIESYVDAIEGAYRWA